MVHLRGRELSVLREIMDNPIASEAEHGALAARRVYEKPASLPVRVLIVIGCALATAVSIWAAKGLMPVIDARQATNGHLLAEIEAAQEHQENLVIGRELAAGDLERERERVLTAAGYEGPPPSLRIAAATAEVEGPGISVTFTATSQVEAKMRDRELSLLVNYLFAAGGEAISINGHRLGTTAAIRAAGGAILVNLQPLLPPYRVEAIGDTTALQGALVEGESGKLLLDLRGRGIQVDVVPEPELRLPAAPIPNLDDTRTGKDS